MKKDGKNAIICCEWDGGGGALFQLLNMFPDRLRVLPVSH